MYYPSLEMLEEMDLSQYDLVPIKKEIYSDMITPIELMRKLKQYSKHVYMLESHEDKNRSCTYREFGWWKQTERRLLNGLLRAKGKA